MRSTVEAMVGNGIWQLAMNLAPGLLDSEKEIGSTVRRGRLERCGEESWVIYLLVKLMVRFSDGP